MTITSHDMISENYLRLNISSGGLSRGSIDFISEKINFNISGRSFFKGMTAINQLELEYSDGKLIFIFKNKKNLEFNCSLKEFEKVNAHIQTHGYRKTY
ncbi:hypothetical protein G6053_13585 [Sphingobacterium sp. DR205]|nr:hypothetical protein G6053_13585 [Sphingobacterium sp. DR205]